MDDSALTLWGEYDRLMAESPTWEGFIMILPRVKEYQENDAVFTADICYNAECEKATFAARLLGYYLPAISIKAGEEPNIFFEEGCLSPCRNRK